MDIMAAVMGAATMATVITVMGDTTILILVIIREVITGTTLTGVVITAMPITTKAAIITTMAFPMRGRRISPALQLRNMQALPKAAVTPAEDIPAEPDTAAVHTTKAATHSR